jgi:hypothetical protein
MNVPWALSIVWIRDYLYLQSFRGWLCLRLHVKIEGESAYTVWLITYASPQAFFNLRETPFKLQLYFYTCSLKDHMAV